MIYYFLLIGYYRLFLHKYRRHIFHQKVSAGYQPYIENRGKDKGLCSGLPEFVDTGFRTQGSHGHCQHECIYLIDPIYNRMRKQVERIETNHGQETKRKPRNSDLTTRRGNAPPFLPPLTTDFTAVRANMKLMTTSTGANIITRIIFTMMAESEIPFPIASPAPTTWATSCRVAPYKSPSDRESVHKVRSGTRRIQKHGNSTENHDSRHGHSRFIWLCLMVDSAPRIAAAPQIPLPMEVSNAIPRPSSAAYQDRCRHK